MQIFKRLGRSSPAMIVAVTALSVALVGTAIAGPDAVVSLLDRGEKRQVKKIAKRQANKQIKRKASRLSVANAENADNATTAGTAANSVAVGGNRVIRIAYRTPGVNGDNQTILDLNGLQMKADCNGSNATITADTTVADSFIWWTTNRDFGDPVYASFSDFDPGEPQNLAVGKTTRNMGGEIRYTTPSNQIVVVNWGADAGGCNVFGFAIG